MGKDKGGFLTPKAIANRIKAKGLQKLRWYCQMCQKQCRDENGFKCHLTSESHQRQLLLFAENPDKYIDTFSQEFLDDFMELLRRRFGTKRVQANIVYQEYIAYRDHVHMNSTQWETLTDFVKWLGREGKCVVDQTEKGWYITYIDRDPEAIRRQEAAQKKEKMDMDDEEKTAMFIQQQIERAAAQGKEVPEAEYTELQRDNEEGKVTFNLGGQEKKAEQMDGASKPGVASLSNPLESLDKRQGEKKQTKETKGGRSKEASSIDSAKGGKGSVAGHKRKSALDEIMEFEEQKREKLNRKDYWLHPGIVVKVITKKLGDKYYKKKAVVKEVKDLYAGVIKMLDSGDKLKVDQAHVETVIPALGKTVLIVNGAYRGNEATLLELDERKFCCKVTVNSGPLKGRTIEKVQYEDISKLHMLT